jgi:hypothetical protein
MAFTRVQVLPTLRVAAIARRLTSRHQQRNAGDRLFPLPLQTSPQAMG